MVTPAITRHHIDMIKTICGEGRRFDAIKYVRGIFRDANDGACAKDEFQRARRMVDMTNGVLV